MIRRRDLVVLTAAKTVASTALRWLGPFLPTLERAFSTSIGTLTSILAIAEMAGLTTALTGRTMDRGHQRRIVIAGLFSVALGCLLAIVGNIWWFGIGATIVVAGVANLTVAGHAWISERVAYAARGRALGTYELSWALALLVGAPIVAVLIDVGGWRAPFAGLAVGATLAAIAVTTLVPAEPAPAARYGHADVATSTGRPSRFRGRVPAAAWAPLLASGLCGASGLAVFVVSGAWLGERHGVTTAGLGLVAMGFGGLELLASGSSAAWADRIGKRNAVAIGIFVQVVGVAVTATSGDSLLVAVAGLTMFLCGFEFAFVTALSLVSEANPLARGDTLGIGHGLATLMRAAAVLVSGQLYESVGLGGTLALSTLLATGSAIAVVRTR